MTKNILQHERYRGCLLGLAVGDAVGTTLEFNRPGTFKSITDMVGGGPFRLQPGQWTDDTSMALCLATSLIDCDGFDAKDQMDCYIRWMNEGYLSSNGKCFDIGNAVSMALRRYSQSGNPVAGSTDPRSAGNGSIMRLAPVPMFYGHDFAEAVSKSALSSRTTHGATAAVDACRYFGGLLYGALNGASKEALLSDHYQAVPGYWQANPLCPEIDRIAAGSFKNRQPPEIRGTGYVVESLEAALWAFLRTETYRDGCLLAANLGDDADTTAAVYGQLAGAYYGEKGIPEAWLEKLTMRGVIEDSADRLGDRH